MGLVLVTRRVALDLVFDIDTEPADDKDCEADVDADDANIFVSLPFNVEFLLIFVGFCCSRCCCFSFVVVVAVVVIAIVLLRFTLILATAAGHFVVLNVVIFIVGTAAVVLPIGLRVVLSVCFNLLFVSDLVESVRVVLV